MNEYFAQPVFVMGLPRSGSSMVAGVLNLCGAWAGRTVAGGVANPKGFFENIAIREQIVKQILSGLNCDPLGVRKLPPEPLMEEIAGLDQMIRSLIEVEGYANDRPWLYKDAKLTLLWPVFAKAFPLANWVVVQRPDEDIIRSCLRTHFMNQHSLEHGYWQQFICNYKIRIKALEESGARCFSISTQQLVQGHLDEMQTLVESLGLDFNKTEVREFICPEFWHGRVEAAQPGSRQ